MYNVNDSYTDSGITATATNGTDDTSDDKTATCTVTVTEPTTKYNLTLANGNSANGTVTFTMGGETVNKAGLSALIFENCSFVTGFFRNFGRICNLSLYKGSSED